MISGEQTKPRVGLFVTCLVDLVRPSIGFAAAKLIEASGCIVVVPKEQTCCGQPAYNSGAHQDAKVLARQTISAFDGLDYVVAPSGSCAAMLKVHVPRLFSGDPEMEGQAAAFAGRVYELLSFLVDVRRLELKGARCRATATFHDSCSGLRELHVKNQPRRLLAAVEGLSVVESREAETCCGFGGLFSTKYPDISAAMGDRKVTDAASTGAGLLLAGDLGCLMHLAGLMTRQGRPIACRHVAEVLAGEMDDPPIGQPRFAP